MTELMVLNDNVEVDLLSEMELLDILGGTGDNTPVTYQCANGGCTNINCPPPGGKCCGGNTCGGNTCGGSTCGGNTCGSGGSISGNKVYIMANCKNQK